MKLKMKVKHGIYTLSLFLWLLTNGVMVQAARVAGEEGVSPAAPKAPTNTQLEQWLQQSPDEPPRKRPTPTPGRDQTQPRAKPVKQNSAEPAAAKTPRKKLIKTGVSPSISMMWILPS